MKDQNSPIDILKKLLGVVNDCELAPLLGCTKQAIASARRRGNLSNRLLAAAAEKCGRSLEEMKNLLPVVKQDRGSPVPTREELWIELRKCLEDNRKLMEDNRRLLSENRYLRNGGR